MQPDLPLVDPTLLTKKWTGRALKAAVIDLSSAPENRGSIILPPFPLIGIGSPAHALAPDMDILVEAPVNVEVLLNAIEAQPLAAAVLVKLLRSIDRLDDINSLVAESLAYAQLQGSDPHTKWLASRAIVSPKAEGRVLISRTEDCLTIILDRPAARNAIDRPMRDALCAAFDVGVHDSCITHIEMGSTGKAFCVGADLSEFGTTRDPKVAHAIRLQTLPAHRIVQCADRLHVHIQGACVGAGLEMAAFARRVTARSTAWFQLPELAMGLIPGAGGCVSVSRRIGRQRTALMVVSGKRISAQTALAWGLIDAIIDD